MPGVSVLLFLLLPYLFSVQGIAPESSTQPSANSQWMNFQPYPDDATLNAEFWAWYLPPSTAVEEDDHPKPQPQQKPGALLQAMASIGQSARLIDPSPVAGMFSNKVGFQLVYIRTRLKASFPCSS